MKTNGYRATESGQVFAEDKACAQRIRGSAGITVFQEAPFKEPQFQTLELKEEFPHQECFVEQ